MDEKAIGKGHHFLTVVLDADTGEVLHLAEGKRKASLQGFFDKLTLKQKKSIKVVGIDRAGAYKAVMDKEIPNADSVYDKFHKSSPLDTPQLRWGEKSGDSPEADHAVSME